MPRWPWAIPALCAAAVLGGILLTLSGPEADTTYLLLDTVVGLTYPAVGALIATRRPGNPVGWLLCAGGAGLALQALAGGYAWYGGAHGWPGAGAAAWATNWVFFLGFGPLLLQPLLLPDGRLPSRRWRPVLVVLLAEMAVVQLMLPFRDRVWVWGREWPSPLGLLPTETVVAPMFAVAIASLTVATVAAPAVRVRRAGRGPDEDHPDQTRRRLVPVFAAVLAMALATTADLVLPPTPPIGVWLEALALPLFPVAVAVAIFRYRLFDIEVLLRRTVVYVVVTVVLLGAYLVTVATLDTLVREQGGTLEALAATAVVAVAFAPLRHAVQRAVSRVLFGNRGDPASALSELGQRLKTSADPTRLLDGAAEIVAHTLRLPSVAVLAADGTPMSVEGGLPSQGVRVPLLVGGREEGELRAAPRSPGETLSAADTAVLDDLARHLAVALAAVRLAREVQTSREGLVIAREEERRRLRRDLHDGLGPGLAAIGVRLDLIEATAPEAMRGQLAEVRQLTQGLVGDVRRIVHDLRPPALDELGLGGALEDLALDAEGGAAVTVTLPGPLPDLPAAVEVAAYRIVQEALANALRHAGANSVEISAVAEPGDLRDAGSAAQARLVVTVRDDGRGLPERLVEGVGSGSMRERAAELGGRLRRTSGPTGGTTVEAVLPL